MKGTPMLAQRAIHRLFLYVNSAFQMIKWRGLSVNGLLQSRFDTQITITNKGTISLGRDVMFQRGVSLSSVGGCLSIGNNVSINRNCIIVCHNNINIADNVIFGPGVTIYDHDHIFSELGILPGFKSDAVVIEKGCWIGSNVTILRGTHIGQDSVIGAGCIIKGEIPPHSLVVGDRSIRVIPLANKYNGE